MDTRSPNLPRHASSCQRNLPVLSDETACDVRGSVLFHDGTSNSASMHKHEQDLDLGVSHREDGRIPTGTDYF